MNKILEEKNTNNKNNAIEIDQQIIRLEHTIQNLQDQIQQLNKNNGNILSQATEVEHQNDQLQTQNDQLQKQNNALLHELDKLQKTLQNTEKRLKESPDKKTIDEAYETAIKKKDEIITELEKKITTLMDDIKRYDKEISKNESDIKKDKELLTRANDDIKKMSENIDVLTQKISELKNYETEIETIKNEKKQVEDENQRMYNELQNNKKNYDGYKASIKTKDLYYNQLLEKYHNTVSGMENIIRFLLQKQNISIDADALFSSSKKEEPLEYIEVIQKNTEDHKKKYITTYEYTTILNDLKNLLGDITNETTKQKQLLNIKDTISEIDTINKTLLDIMQNINGVSYTYEISNKHNAMSNLQLLINIVGETAIELNHKHDASKKIVQYAFKYIYETIASKIKGNEVVNYPSANDFASLIEVLYDDKLLLLYKPDTAEAIEVLVACYCLYIVFKQKTTNFNGNVINFNDFKELVPDVITLLQEQTQSEEQNQDEKKGGSIFDKPLLIASPVGVAGMFTAIKLRLNAILICILLIVVFYICYKIYKNQFKKNKQIYVAYVKY
jgi:Skp family chaperone for outer membrane proteins